MKRILLLGLMCFYQASCSVLVITHAYNRPDFIELQYKTFRAFHKDKYRFVVFNDAPNGGDRARIDATCKRLGIESIPVPPSVHAQSYPVRFIGEPLHHEIRCAQTMQYSLETVGFGYNGPVVLIDSDVFLVRNFSFSDCLKGYQAAGIIRDKRGLRYIKNGIALFDFTQMPQKESLHFYPLKIGTTPLGVGGATYQYFKSNPNVLVRALEEVSLAALPLCIHKECMDCHPCVHELQELASKGLDEKQLEFVRRRPPNIAFYCRGAFLHYGGGTNWNGRSAEYNLHKTKLVREYIETILKDK